MTETRTASDPGPFALTGHWDGFSMLLRRASYTGLLPMRAQEAFPSVSVCDQIVSISENMERAGLPVKASFHRLAVLPAWQHCVDAARADRGGRLDSELWRESWGEIATPLGDAVDDMNDQIEMSPRPAGEWGPAIGTLGEELLSQLLSASPSSIRRYASHSRNTPQDVAERLHFIALLLADLAGSYNDFGIRRWFARSRSALNGQSPAAMLGRNFDIEGEAAAAVARLATALTGAGAV